MKTGPIRHLIRSFLIGPAVVLGVPLLLLVSPVFVVVAMAADLVSRSSPRRFVRLLGMAMNYLVLEWVGVVLAFVLWIATGFGWFMAAPWSNRLHHRVQRWWAGAIFGAARRWLGLEVRFEGGPLVADGPVVIASQHASFVDALLPSIVLRRHSSLTTRHVLKRELAWDPCLGIYGHRLPNHFVARGGTERANTLDAIETLAATAGDEALVIFPEGTFRTAAAADRILERFREREPARAARLRLSHLLPPRPGGLLALLRGRPDADIVFMAHRGFEPFGSFRAIAANVPFTTPVTAKLWRIPAADIPTDEGERLAFVDEWWQRMDDWVASGDSNQLSSISSPSTIPRPHRPGHSPPADG